MTVLLVGVGADTDHVRPALHLDEAGRFEYLPIPETEPTSERTTYGSWNLDHREGTATQFVDGIRPKGEDGTWINNQSEISSWPVHHDPNFEALSFGDRRGSGGKGASISKHLTSGDILGFYTGIKRSPDDDDLHRFLYGYMSVGAVHDLNSLDKETYYNKLRQFPANAHAKRLEGGGSPKHDDLVIVDGTTPAEKFTYPIRMSERIEKSPWYKITDEFASDFAVQSGLKGICRKFPVKLDLESSEFIEKIQERRCRQHDRPE